MWPLWIVPAAIVALFAMLVVVVHSSKRYERAALAVLGRSTCPACDHQFTPVCASNALREHRARRAMHIRDAAARGAKLRLSPNWRFPCPSCGVELDYVPEGELRALQQ